MAKALKYWLFKTEPGDYSIQDLAAETQQSTCWDGVRNYQARNFLRDEIQVGNRVLLYHSNSDPSAIVGVARVIRAGYPDPTAWDANDKHHDPKATQENPRWYMVDIQLEQTFAAPLSLAELRDVRSLQGMELLRKGSRLSIQPVRKSEFQTILKLAGRGKTS